MVPPPATERKVAVRLFVVSDGIFGAWFCSDQTTYRVDGELLKANGTWIVRLTAPVPLVVNVGPHG